MEKHIEAVIEAFADAFEEAKRSDGTRFYRLREGSPQWMADAVRDAHDGALPYDWRYEACFRVVDKMREYDVEALDDSLHEIADTLVDDWMSDLALWLGAHPAHAEAVNEAMTSWCVEETMDIAGRISLGQMWLLRLIACRLWAAIKDQAAELRKRGQPPTADSLLGVEIPGLASLLDALSRADIKGLLPEEVREAWVNLDLSELDKAAKGEDV